MQPPRKGYVYAQRQQRWMAPEPQGPVTMLRTPLVLAEPEYLAEWMGHLPGRRVAVDAVSLSIPSRVEEARQALAANRIVWAHLDLLFLG